MTNEIFNNILRVFSFYYYNNIVLDNEFFINVLGILKNSHLKDYINRIIILDVNLDRFSFENVINDDTKKYSELVGLAIYDVKNKDIFLRYNVINRSIREEKYIIGCNRKSDIIFRNLYVLQVLLHEIEHVNQMYLLEHGNNIESYLLRETDYYVNNSYSYRLKERLAEVKSSKYILILIDMLKIDNDCIRAFFERNIFKRLIKGYEYQNIEGKITNNEEDILIGPIEKYFIEGDKSLEKIFEISELLSIEERVLYGLPLTSKNFLGFISNYRKERDKIYLKL